MKNKNKKEGATLLYVMIVTLLLTLTGQILVQSTFRVQRESQNLESKYVAFWSAQGGLNWTKAMVQNMRVPFEQHFKITKKPNRGKSWGHEKNIGTFSCSSNLDIEKLSSVGLVSTRSTYAITSTATNGPNVVTLRQTMSIDSLAAYAAVILESMGARFTRYDKFFGKTYFGKGIKLKNADGGYTTFMDDVRVASSSVEMGGTAVSEVSQLLSYDSADGPKVFQTQISLNAPPIDETTTFNENSLNKIKALAIGPRGLTLPSGSQTIRIDGKNIIVTTTNGPVKHHNIDVVYAPNDLVVEGVVDGILSIAVEGNTYIGTKGITYESAPCDSDIGNWTNSQKDQIDDTFGLISRETIYPMGDQANDSNINIHGAIMSVTGGITPYNYWGQTPKRSFRVYGSAIMKKLIPTESDATGYGCHWMTDSRFRTGKMAPIGFPHDPYSFTDWKRM